MRSRWLVLALVLTSCGVDAAGSATTIVPIGPTDFATIPPAVTTIAPVVTTLPPGAVGVEQIYVVQAGDSPILVANLFGISVEQLLSWNGLLSTSQFPYPGRQLKIPPSASK
ncbi:MAG: LysM peptidoglycan-binding domain-containing protein, partial [Ilumatobacteraceae bacterium]